MESRFGHDFGDVRIHLGASAAASARALRASAYTVGSDVVFHDSVYQTVGPPGDRLIARELALVVQQRGATSESASPAQAMEEDADRAADAWASGGPIHVAGQSPDHRQVVGCRHGGHRCLNTGVVVRSSCVDPTRVPFEFGYTPNEFVDFGDESLSCGAD